MQFPLWQYLDQPIWDRDRPFVLNPIDYWRQYRRQHLKRCLSNAFLEQCWQANYPNFVIDYQDFCSRNALEEDPRWLLERCWHWQRRNLYSGRLDHRFTQHPENYDMEPESDDFFYN
ncbi:MAG: hypothetical protein AAF773_03645 [Cyanobacteria bacterium P01_D01_bin.115]